MAIQRSQKEMQEREEENTVISIFDKDGNLIIETGMPTKEEKKRLEENKREKK
jgi:hypothetical protein